MNDSISEIIDKEILHIQEITLKAEKFKGSTTIIPDLITKLDNMVIKSPDGQSKVVDLYNWLIKNRGFNTYIPYGYVSRFRKDYLVKKYTPLKQHNKDRYEGIARENSERSIKAKEIRENKMKVKMDKYKKIAEIKKDERDKVLFKLKQLNDSQKIDFILTDKKQPINYYPQEYANLFTSNLDKLSKNQFLKLKEVLVPAKKGKWRDLRKLIKQLHA